MHHLRRRLMVEAHLRRERLLFDQSLLHRHDRPLLISEQGLLDQVALLVLKGQVCVDTKSVHIALKKPPGHVVLEANLLPQDFARVVRCRGGGIRDLRLRMLNDVAPPLLEC